MYRNIIREYDNVSCHNKFYYIELIIIKLN